LAVDDLTKLYPVYDVVYGSGFENNIQSLFFLQEKLNLLGNSPEVFRNVQHKSNLFNFLLENNILFPEVHFSRPELGKWLIKPLQSEGGFGIRHENGHGIVDKKNYWQRYLEGKSMSVLFIADGEKAEILGFNKQWTVSHSNGQAFVFSGIHNYASLSDLNKRTVADWLAKLVSHFGLRGLSSVDFILHQKHCYFLEINPRPTASIELYDANVFTAHVSSSLGQEVVINADKQSHKGYQIIYAESDFQIPEDIIWPEWSQDRPKSGAIIREQQPVCSIIANGESSQQVLAKLKTRQSLIENTIKQDNSYHAIHS
jgi:methenyltetrahydromethanopterin cyclohydrolase